MDRLGDGDAVDGGVEVTVAVPSVGRSLTVAAPEV